MRCHARRLWLIIACLVASIHCARAADTAHDSHLIQINIYCTTCDDFIRCQSGNEAYTLYRLRAKTFWAQIATIWDYLIARIRPKTTDTRPLTVYLASGEHKKLLRDGLSAQIDLVAATIVLPEARIDMREGEWRGATGEPQGRCAILPRRDGYAFVREVLGRPLSRSDRS